MEEGHSQTLPYTSSDIDEEVANIFRGGRCDPSLPTLHAFTLYTGLDRKIAQPASLSLRRVP